MLHNCQKLHARVQVFLFPVEWLLVYADQKLLRLPNLTGMYMQAIGNTVTFDVDVTPLGGVALWSRKKEGRNCSGHHERESGHNGPLPFGSFISQRCLPITKQNSK